jgi:hypothetical protein
LEEKKPAARTGIEQGSSERAASKVPSETKVPKHFEGELPMSFQDMAEKVQGKDRMGLRVLIFLLQPVLGALPHRVKKKLETTVAAPVFFTTPMATGLNVLLNMLLFPGVFMAFAIGSSGINILFSKEINSFILLGFTLALLEGFFRLREGIFHARPAGEMTFHGSFYGFLLSGLVQVLIARCTKMLRNLPVPVEGFYEKRFVEKLERGRRYGHAYTIEDLGQAYHLRMEFPREVPDIGLVVKFELPPEMPDYDYRLLLENGHFIVKGRCTDERIRSISSSVGAFPPEFTAVIPLKEKVKGFSHRFENKLLEVLLLKEKAADL